jgi:hypothetical protein
MKTEVYSWRVSADLKAELEREARRRNEPLSRLLDLAAREWLKKRASEYGDEDEQARLHKVGSKFVGLIEGTDARRSENVRHELRGRLRRRYDR